MPAPPRHRGGLGAITTDPFVAAGNEAWETTTPVTDGSV